MVCQIDLTKKGIVLHSGKYTSPFILGKPVQNAMQRSTGWYENGYL